MKITDIECFVVEEELTVPFFEWRRGLPAGGGDGTPLPGHPRNAYLRMTTDEGIFGELKMGRGDAVADVVRRRLKGFIDKDPLYTELLWTEVWEIDRLEEFQLFQLGIIDLLCWDIKSKLANLPLHILLGGNKSQVQAYASTVTFKTLDDYERNIKLCQDVGFTAFKLHGWGDVAEDARLAKALRQWVGPDAQLMFDASGGWSVDEALKFGRVLEGEGYLWFEEPMREFDIFSYQRLCSALDIPVLAAETSDGCHWNVSGWIQANALDMARTNPFFKGGLTGAIKIAHLAESHGMKAQVHGSGPVQLRLAAAIPNNDFYEQLVYDEAHIKSLAKEMPAIVDGFANCPATPGLGFEIDWAKVESTALYSA